MVNMNDCLVYLLSLEMNIEVDCFLEGLMVISILFRSYSVIIIYRENIWNIFIIVISNKNGDEIGNMLDSLDDKLFYEKL